MKYTIICPIKISGGNGWTIFRDASLYSYAKYLNVSDIASFVIICPKNDIQEIREQCDKFAHIPFIFLSDEEVLEKSCENFAGWYKQQLIKLLVSKHVTTHHYLIVDSDMYLTRPLNASDLFHNNRVKYVSEPWQTLNNSDYSTNSKWWENSCNVLRLNVETLHDEKHLMGVTPQVFITTRVHQLLRHLEHIHGKKWKDIICEMCFTEFTLYWLFMCINKYDRNEYTHDGEQLWRHDKLFNVLDENMDINDALKIVQKTSTIFSVIQGYLHIPFIDDLCTQIRKNIAESTKTEYDAIFVIPSMVTPTIARFFTPEERYQQTLYTIHTIREKVPNSFCLIIEGSKISQEQREQFSQISDHLIMCDCDIDVRKCVNDTRNIGIGECKLLEIGMNFILEQKISAKMCIKLGSRYYLNENFDLSNYDTSKYNFRKHFDECVLQDVYTTGLFTIPMKNIPDFIQTQGTMIAIINHNDMVERLYCTIIPIEQVNDVKVLGLGGRLNYNGKNIRE